MTPVPWWPIARVGLGSFGVMLSFACILPIFPVWTQRFTGSLTNVGLATTLAAGVGLILARPVAARLMEGRRRAPTMLLGAGISAVVAVTFPSAPDLLTVMGLRVLHAFGFGLIATAGLSAITDFAPPARRGEIIGYYGALNAVSLLLGPWIGAVLDRNLGVEWAFYAAGALSMFAFFSVIGLQELPKPTIPGRARLMEVLRIPALRLISSAHLLALTLHGALLAFLPIRMAEHPGWFSIELFFAIDGLVVILFRAAVGRRFDALPRKVFIIIGLAAMGAASVCIAVGGTVALFAAAVLYGLGFGSYIPAASALVGDVVPETHRARGFAIYLLALDLGLALGGVVYGPPAESWGVRFMFYLAAAGPIVAIALYGLFGGVGQDGQWERPTAGPPRSA